MSKKKARISEARALKHKSRKASEGDVITGDSLDGRKSTYREQKTAGQA
jgi:hypothetical protein